MKSDRSSSVIFVPTTTKSADGEAFDAMGARVHPGGAAFLPSAMN
jgi:hypothetical protein